MTELDSRPTVSRINTFFLFLTVAEELGEGPGRPGPLPLFWVKKEKKRQREEKPAGNFNSTGYLVKHNKIATHILVTIRFAIVRYA